MELRTTADEADRERNLVHVSPYLQRDSTKINLSLNESHIQVPERVRTAIAAALNRLHEYPIGLEPKVIEEVAAFYGVVPAQVAITHGLDDALDQLIESFRDMRFSIFEPTFFAYKERLRLSKVRHQILRLDEHFAIPKDTLSHLGKEDFVLLANPNNPTGTVFDEAVIDQLQNNCGKILVDEAYIDFCGQQSRIGRIDDRTFVFRSLSKIFALAGLRLGFLFGSEANMAPIKNRQWFCNISTGALEAIRAVLRDPFISEHAKLVVQSREQIQFAATELGFHVREGFGNFVLIRHPDSQHLVLFLDSQGICVTDTAVHGLEDHVRISLGTAAENGALVEALRRYASQFGMSSDVARRLTAVLPFPRQTAEVSAVLGV
ncbi:MAG: histidinol-phosphate transaminase [Xanthobacteraceae bacterium]